MDAKVMEIDAPVRTFAKCKAKAPCGYGCCCNAKVKHTLHICKDATCLCCHSESRYLEDKASRSGKNG
jgi:hypothetical protein